jgi:hypothetical protein
VTTVLDVLENALEGELTSERAAALTDRDLITLEEVLNEFYSAWQPASSPDSSLRAYPGGWVAANYAAPQARSLLATTLLYFDAVLIHDPVGEWFDRRRDKLTGPPPIRYRNGAQLQSAEAALMSSDGYHHTRDNPDRTREQLKWMLPMLADFAPLIGSGIVIPFNQIGIVVERQSAILTAVRHDVRDAELIQRIREPIDLQAVTADYSRGLQLNLQGAGSVFPGDESRLIAQNPSYFLNKTIALADATGSRYTPPAATDTSLYHRRLERAGDELSRRAELDLRVASALTRTELPFVTEIDARTLVEIRQQEDAFGQWRAQLRTVVKQIESAPESGQFADEAKEAFDDGFAAVAAEVRRAGSRSQVLRASTRDATINLVTGVAVAGGAALAGVDAPTAVATASLSAIAQWTLRSLFPPKHSGTRAVIAALMSPR